MKKIKNDNKIKTYFISDPVGGVFEKSYRDVRK